MYGRNAAADRPYLGRDDLCTVITIALMRIAEQQLISTTTAMVTVTIITATGITITIMPGKGTKRA